MIKDSVVGSKLDVRKNNAATNYRPPSELVSVSRIPRRLTDCYER